MVIHLKLFNKVIYSISVVLLYIFLYFILKHSELTEVLGGVTYDLCMKSFVGVQFLILIYTMFMKPNYIVGFNFVSLVTISISIIFIEIFII